MKKFAILILSLLLVFIIINAVSAENNITQDFDDNGVDAISNTQIDKINDNDKTFDELQHIINNCKENSTIKFNGTYYGNETTIIINKTLTIEGDNATLNARYLSGILKINADNVVLKNINFVKSSNNNKAIFWQGDNGKIINCTFKNNFPNTIFYEGNNVKIINSIFENNSFFPTLIGGSYLGHDYSGLYCKGNNSIIDNCSFINNLAIYGDSIYLDGDYNVITNSLFLNNYDSVFLRGNNDLVYNCTFDNNGDAIKWYGNDGVINNSYFDTSFILVYGSNVLLSNIISNNTNEGNYLFKNAFYLFGEKITICNSIIINDNFSPMKGFVLTNKSEIAFNFINWVGNYGILKNTVIYDSHDNNSVLINWTGVNGQIINSTFHCQKNDSVLFNDFKGKYNEYNKTWNFSEVNVNPEIFNLIINKKDSIYKCKNIITVKALKNNKIVKDALITLKIANKIHVKSTGNNGIANFELPFMNAGKYNLQITAFNNKIIKNNSLKVYKAKITTKITTKKKTTTITIKSYKKPVMNLKIKLKVFTGKKYKIFNLKTNKNGQIFIKNLKKGLHKIEITTTNKNYDLNIKTKLRV